MQAHQSSSAARTSFEAPLTTSTSTAAVAEPLSSFEAHSSLVQSVDLAHGASLAHGAGLAHDAGNLFGALGLYCDLLASPGVLRPEHQHYITELRQLATRSSALIQRLLSSSNCEQMLKVQPVEDMLASAFSSPTPLKATPEAPNAAAILREAEPLLSAIAGSSVTVTCKAPRALPTPLIQRESLERILVNLVRNASQAIELSATKRHGNIRITLATIAGQMRLTVEDNGPGMPVTTAASFISPTPLPPGATRGLGHRIVHELVTASGGTLTLRVRPGRGTTINILWPVPSTQTPVQPAPANNSGSRRLGAATC
ncbi:sensor histidine kinase [Granulicella paludicola]|uniref:sensor histidine kinase n=1 Tax=Granulicella paludicola TaxID=474951 RepID=UPI0021E04CC8|nr:ATP-binding protein [Granulicella paludicola]